MKLRPSFWVGAVLVGSLCLLALLTPYLPLRNPYAHDLAHQYASPSMDHPLGLGDNGVDLLSQVLWGSRISLSIGLSSVAISALVGLVLGSVAGYLRGAADLALIAVVDTLYAFPGILLVVALAAVLGPSLKNILIVLVLTSWAGYARLVRGICFSLREREFIQSARAMGCSTPRILVRHIWPNLMSPLIVQMTFGLGSAILTESSLSFLGLGAPPGTPSWGQMLNEGREVLTSATHLVLVPGIALVVTVLGLNLLGDGLRDWLDPKVL